MKVEDVDVIHSYGDKPDPEEIRKSVRKAKEEGLELADTEAYGTRGTHGSPLHVVILYYEKSKNKLGNSFDRIPKH